MNGFFAGGVAEGMSTRRQLDQRDRELGLKETSLDQALGGALLSQTNKELASSIDVTNTVINNALKANASPDKIRSLIAPLTRDIDSLAQKAGRDSAPIMRQFEAQLGVPVGAAGAEKPLTEIGKLRADLSAGHVTQAEFDQRVYRLTREGAEPNTIESIRQKLAAGEQLTAGEKTVYDDALKADPIARLIAGALGTRGATPAAAAPVATPPIKPDPLRLR